MEGKLYEFVLGNWRNKVWVIRMRPTSEGPKMIAQKNLLFMT